MSPSKDDIEDVREVLGEWSSHDIGEIVNVAETFDEALRASEARNALLERQYQEVIDWYKGDRPICDYEPPENIWQRHAREREALK